MVDESLPHKWFHRRGFYKARMLILFTWLFFGNVLSMGYKSTLLSTLIPIREAPHMTSNEVPDVLSLAIISKLFNGSWVGLVEPINDT